MNERSATSDDAERSAALDVSRSFVVQAPAGSGKTELLIQRYLVLLSRVERPEAIVAMTFTRKAAGEIRERIVSALRSAKAGAAPAEAHAALTWRLARAVLQRDAALEWNLIAHPARLQVQTIDALCASLMRRAPLTLKVGTLPRFVDRGMPLYLDAARSELDAAGADDVAWRRLLDHLDNDADRLIELIAGMLAKRDQWLHFVVVDDKEALRVNLEKALVAEIDRELGALDAAFPREVVTPLLKLAHHAGDNLRADQPDHPLASWSEKGGLPPPSVDGLPQWLSIAEWLLTKEGTFRERVTKVQGFLAPSSASASERGSRLDQKQGMEQLLARLEQVPGLVAALHSVRALPPPRYDEASWSFIAALLDVLRHAVARLQLVFAQENAIDYPESTLIALRALSSEDQPSELLLALDMQIEHLLLDEFQDTSLAQHQLVEHLTEGWTPGDGRTLFIVGDPMQSIYRFREADVGLFLAAQSNRRVGGVALEPLTLTRNFRSQQGLVDWVNATFSNVFSSYDDPARGAVAFKPSAATRQARADGAVTVDLCTDAVQEAAVVVSHIRGALASTAESIAVLVRKRSDLGEILPALRAGDIAFSAVELDQLSERQTVLDLCSLAHALVQPDDRLAWLATLRAPWCGLTLPDLFAVAQTCGKRALSEALSGELADNVLSLLSADGRERYTRFAEIIAPLREERGRRPLATVVRGAWLALGGPACVIDPIDLEAADRFFALLGEHEVGADVPDWAMFIEALNALRAEAEADPSTRVRIMTLHRAKGLEFDVAIMPGLARHPRREDRQLHRPRPGRRRVRLPARSRRRRGRSGIGPAVVRRMHSGEGAAASDLVARVDRGRRTTQTVEGTLDANGAGGAVAGHFRLGIRTRRRHRQACPSRRNRRPAAAPARALATAAAPGIDFGSERPRFDVRARFRGVRLGTRNRPPHRNRRPSPPLATGRGRNRTLERTTNRERAQASLARACCARLDRQRSRRSRGAGAVGDRGNHLRLARTLVVRSRPRRGVQRICIDRVARRQVCAPGARPDLCRP
jgi:ATP-dependent helicase/nuclease subunit A